ncbi:hypothetical protein EDB80DRAFT_879307 [Ilyonectria destructans]|nr:hypothetical protein EDB80DRAFT_879307 [Ilyonectria destructans]
MEAVGAAANIIAVIDLSAKVATLCFQYYTEVAGAQADITRLQSQVNHQCVAFRGARQLLEEKTSQPLATSRELVDSLQECERELRRLEDKLDPSRARKAMRRFGLRALRWPFSRKEIESVIANLERCEQTIMFGLQVDQTRILLDINDKIEGISLQVADDSPRAHKPHFMVPFPADPDFVERPAIWTWLTERYEEPASRIALVGMGGFGKSQIAIRFAYHVHTTSPNTSIFWVYGSTKARFEESYRSIADTLALPRRHDPSVNVLTLVRDWLQRDDVSPWLMILDNADDLDMFFSKDEGVYDTQVPIASCLPKTHKGKILVTSRSLTVSEKLTGSHKAILRIPTMGSFEALKLFRKKLDGDIDEVAAADLVSTLDFIPLAVNQSAAYINRRAPRVTVRSYLVDLQRSRERIGSLLNSDAGDLRRHEGVSNAVVVTWQVTFEQIRRERPAAANLLSLMSLFQAQSIPEYVLHDYSDVETNGGESGFEDDLDVLRGYSLVNITTTKGFCEMHSLVKFCTQVWISMFGELRRWKKLFLSLASEHFPSGKFETWEQCQTLLPHFQSILKDEPAEESDWPGWCNLLANTSRYTFNIGEYQKAEILAQNAFGMRIRILGEENSATLHSMTSLASIYAERGRWKEAEELQVKALGISSRVLGEEHVSTLVSMTDLATTYRYQGRWREAEELQAKQLEICSRVLGKKHLSTISGMAQLASIYWDQGRLNEAEELELQVIETRKKVSGEEHPITLVSMENLASTYRLQGRWGEAEELGAQVVEIQKRVLGEEHPDTLTSMANLATTYQYQGRWGEAEELQTKELGICSRVLGEEHVSTLASMANLARIYWNQGRMKEAEALEVQAMESRKRVLGNEHPDTLSSMANLANGWHSSGRYGEAIALRKDCVGYQERILGRDHPHTQRSISILESWQESFALV